MVQLFHHLGLLAQQLVCPAAPVLDPFSRDADGAVLVGVVDLLDDAEGARSQDPFDGRLEARVDLFRLGEF
jgi:hypothetical protein